MEILRERQRMGKTVFVVKDVQIRRYLYEGLEEE